MRTVADLFIQAGLLPATHPAALYGEPGVERYKFSKMLGDAWYTLQSTAATPYQWSVFCSVLLMIFFVISSAIMTVINLSTVFIGSAAAQIYANPWGDSTISTIPAQGAFNFDRTVPPQATAHGDYGIMILDKMLRISMADLTAVCPSGCPLQSAVQPLMAFYNSGIMVIAGVMLFWLIISVVVDIAKTGQIGGGRHNMVWAPIRIVFALGIMTPLGASGFSSGQYMVMKLAEWGNNFGSTAWNKYLAAALHDPIYQLPPIKNMTSFSGKLARSWVCIVAHNGYSYQAEGTLLSPDQIVAKYDNVGVSDTGMRSFSYRKETGENVCGDISYPTQVDQVAIFQSTSTDEVEKAKGLFKLSMDKVWQKIADSGTYGLAYNETQMEKFANNFACGFVEQHVWGQVNGQDVLSLNCTGIHGDSAGFPASGTGATVCGSGLSGTGKYPDMSCIKGNGPGSSMVDYLHQQIQTGAMNSYNASFAAINWTNVFSQRGWAGMGDFYRTLSRANAFVLSAADIPVTIKEPKMSDGGQLGQKIDEVVTKYDDWWKTVPLKTAKSADYKASLAPGGGGLPGVELKGEEPGGSSGGDGVLDVLSSIPIIGGIFGGISDIAKLVGIATNIVKSAASGVAGAAEFLGKTMSNALNGDIINIITPDAQDSNVYPLSVLINLGHKLILTGLTIHITLFLVAMALCAVITTNTGGTLVDTPIVVLIGAISTIIMSCGAILSYWLPCLPFIRVTHAVLTWAVSVFEAVVLVPIAALSFLSTTGEGWDAKHIFINWLEILVRPVLTVIGFVGALLVFNTFFAYFFDGYKVLLANDAGKQSDIWHFIYNLIGCGFFALIFCMVIYTAANTCFKMIHLIPDAFFRWAPMGGSASGATREIGDGGDHSGAVGKMGGMMADRNALAVTSQTGGGVGKAGSKVASKIISAFKKPAVTEAAPAEDNNNAGGLESDSRLAPETAQRTA